MTNHMVKLYINDGYFFLVFMIKQLRNEYLYLRLQTQNKKRKKEPVVTGSK